MNQTAQATIAPKCLCGCGTSVTLSKKNTGWNKFVNGHSNLPKLNRSAPSLAPKCACGCGEEVCWHPYKLAWRKFKKGHHSDDNSGGVKTWFHQVASGKRILVQSGWEVSLFDTLDSLPMSFRRSNRLNLGSCTWMPDCVVNSTLIIEVKGHPLAKKFFDENQLQALLEKRFEKAVEVVDWKINPEDYPTFESLLKDLAWISIPPIWFELYHPHALRWYRG